MLQKIISGMSASVKLSDQKPLVEQILGVLDTGDFAEPAILVALGFQREYYDLANDPAFAPRTSVEAKALPLSSHQAFLGAIRHNSLLVPVLSVKGARSAGKDMAIVADWKRLLKWVQYAAASDADDVSKVHGDLLVDVIDLNSNDQRRRAIIGAKPDWLQPISNKDSYLRERVLLRILERFEIEIVDASAGVLLDS
ncbi:MAG: hypothetical protein EOP22_14970 [Hyphomicrobiales bacterium]|nr:MAG: hypothetical protein EOP22_14970 [Hyphomicrobiales bacterium]